jgi:lysophospholipase L1-like esterase
MSRGRWRFWLLGVVAVASVELVARTLSPVPELGILARRPLLDLYPGIAHPEEVFSDLDHSCLRWAPYEHWLVRPDLRRRFFRTNALGLRGRETALPKPAGRFRIVVLGGSAAWGLGSTSDERTLPGQLEAELHRLHPATEMDLLNAAQAGFVSGQELIHYHQEIEPLAPDIVLLFDGYNDIVADLGNPVAGWPQGAEHLKMRYEDFLRSGRFGADLLLFLRGSRAFDLAYQRLAAVGPAAVAQAVTPEMTARRYVENAAALARMIAPRPLWIALQPVLATTRKPLAAEEMAVLSEREQETPGYAARVRDSFARMRDGATSAGISVIPMEDALGSEPHRMFADECHFGDEAAHRLGRHIAEAWQAAHAIP